MKRALAVLAQVVTVAIVAAGGQAVTGLPAQADARAAAPGPDSTVTADALPTVQIDGVVWAQVVIGTTVYVGGQFTTARPAGSPAGVNTVPRSNLLAFDITTGSLISSWAPTTNGPVYALNVSPDKSRVYVGGNFNQVNGKSRNRFAALDPVTGAVNTAFPNGLNGTVRAVTSTSSRVYIGGDFNTVDGQTRNRLAAYDATTGQLLAWTATPDRIVTAMAMSPDGTQVYFGGNFERLNGVQKRGTGALDAVTGQVSSWSIYPSVYNSGANGGITSIATDGNLVYTTAFTFLLGGEGMGNVEGATASDPKTGAIVWIDDCHGDTYSLFPNPGQDHVYVSGHPHMCNNIGAYPEGTWRHWQYGTAYTKAVRGLVTPNTQVGSWYTSNAGYGAPEQLDFYPDFAQGSFTGQSQATWSVTGNSSYVVYGGEFPSVNGTAQQGLARFAKPALATTKRQGPMLSGGDTTPKAVAKARGSIDISWPTNWDRDDGTLTYTVLRNGVQVHQTSAYSRFWAMPRDSWVDTGLADSTTYSYQVRISDSSGNTVLSPSVSATTTSSLGTTLSAYAKAVLLDGPNTYWRMGETSNTLSDWTGYEDLTAYSGVTENVAGALAGDSDRAASFSGANTFSRAVAAQRDFGLNNLSVEAWFKTTSTTGGKIIGFGTDSGAFDSGMSDRHVYMTPAGKLIWGVYPGGVRTVSSTLPYNDGAWHHVVATVGPAGMHLFVDAVQVATDPKVVAGQFTASASQSWHVGGDNLNAWPNAGSGYFAGQIDEVATYGRQLTQAQVTNHHAIGSGKTRNLAPAASFTVTGGVLSASVDASASADPDGTIASYAWTWGDGQTSTSAKPTATHAYAAGGSYPVTLTVTDNDGATATKTATAKVSAKSPATALASDTFSRTIASGGWGTAGLGGPWSATAGYGSVSGTVGVLSVAAANTRANARLDTVQTTGAVTTATVMLDSRPNNSGAQVALRGRITTAGEYRLRVQFKPDGRLTAWLTRITYSNSTEKTIATAVAIPGTYSAGTPVKTKISVVGTNPTTIQAKVWLAGTAEPTTWLLTAADSGAGLQSAGSTGVSLQVMDSTNLPVVARYDDYRVTTG